MRKITLVVIVTFVVFFNVNLLAQTPKLTPLFNGKNFEGWTIMGGNATIKIEENAIKLNQKANTKEHTFLVTKKKFKDFILELDCKRDPGFSYGILFRAQKTPDTAHVRLYGYQIKVDHDKKRNWTGAIFDDFGNTWNWISTLKEDNRAQKALKEAGNWDHYRIEANEDKIRVWINGIATANITNTKYKKGFIALKIHFLGNKPENEKPSAWIKNIKILTSSIPKHSNPIDIPLIKTN
jgi:hypothetical protein